MCVFMHGIVMAGAWLLALIITSRLLEVGHMCRGVTLVVCDRAHSLNMWQCILYACAVERANITTCGPHCVEYFGMRTICIVYERRGGWRSYQTNIHTYKQTVRAQMYGSCGAHSGSPQLCVRIWLHGSHISCGTKQVAYRHYTRSFLLQWRERLAVNSNSAVKLHYMVAFWLTLSYHRHVRQWMCGSRL